MQLRSFPGMKPWGREQIESQLEIFPEGQLCIELEGRIVASSNSLIVDYDRYEDWHDWEADLGRGDTSETTTPDGDTLYGIEIMVDPDYPGHAPGAAPVRRPQGTLPAHEPGADRHRGRIPGYGSQPRGDRPRGSMSRR